MSDLSALEVVYRAEYDNLVRSLALLAGSRDLASDAVQEAFVVAGTRWPEFSLVDEPTAWIRTVAARRLIDGHRRSSRWRRLVPFIARDALNRDHAVDPVRDTDLVSAVAALPHQQRAAVVLYYLADWSVDDVAKALRVAPGTVKSSLHDARVRLRSTLTDGGRDV